MLILPWAVDIVSFLPENHVWGRKVKSMKEYKYTRGRTILVEKCRIASLYSGHVGQSTMRVVTA